MPQPLSIQPGDTPFIELQSVDSTNNYARKQIHAGLAQNGMAIFTHEQTEGKGQRGKIWASEKDVNIALSIIINPHPLLLSQQFQLNACVALATYNFFNLFAGDDTKIKWPNDLYWQDRKAGGILIENIVAGNGNWQWSIIGIGININQTAFLPYLPNPVSLKQITGKNFDLTPLAKNLVGCFYKYWEQLITSGFVSLYEQYNQILYKKDKTVKLRKKNKTFEAKILKVSNMGKLVVQHVIEEEFDYGEIEWVI